MRRMPELLTRYGHKARCEGRNLRLAICPACGGRDDAGVRVDSGTWHCFKCGARGDVFALLALLEGLDVKADFRQVVDRAASVGSVAPIWPPPRAAPLHAPQDFAALWATLARRDARGEAYLAGRGIPPAPLIEGDRVRFTRGGYPAVPLYDLATGAMVGIQYRRTEPDADPKVRTLRGSAVKGAALGGRLADLDPDGVDVALAVEGLPDVLAAIVAFPGCAVFGAPGVDFVPLVVAALAPRVLEVRGWLLLCVDDDEHDQGPRAAGEGIRRARAAGLGLAPRDAGPNVTPSLRLLSLGEHHDLADALRAGWRFQWPV